ncbi:MAG TPA: hypothetical protein V6C91_10605, partial [Coleofasciculaceae cyanobacterium]
VSEAKEKLDQQGIVPKVVLMTGGASRMQFTRQICQEIFPEPESQVRPDPEPERCIALGLARVGRWDLRAAAFKEELNKLLDSNKLKELVEKHIPELIELLTQPLSEGLIENALKPSLKDWQKNKIRTLADLESSMKNRAEQWIRSDRSRQIVNTQCATWFNSKIQPELALQTDPICQKYQIPRSSLRFEEGINPEVVNPEFSIGDAILAETVGFITNVVIGSGTVGSIIALILTGHLTWPIVLVYGVSVLAAGVEITRSRTQEAIKTKLDIPSWSRPFVLSDTKIDSTCEQTKPELEKVFRQQLTENQETFDELIGKVGQELKKALNAKAEEAIILIQ